MRKKYLFAALLLSVCMTAPCTVQASDAKADTTQEAEETADSEETDKSDASGDSSEEDSEDAEQKDAEADSEEESTDESETSEAGTEETTASEEEEEKLERPEYKASDYVTLGEYKNISVNYADLGVSDITDEDVETEMTSQIESLAESADGVVEELTEGEVQSGDVANIDYVGKKDGEAFDGGSAEEYDLEIGSGSFIDGFEDGLIGAAIGDTVDLNLTFPEDYQNSDLAGQDVVFTVTVNSVKRMPEITDDLVNTVTDGEYKDLDSYREYIKSNLESDKEEEIQSAAQQQAFSQVQEASDISGYPDGLQEYTEQFIHDYYENYAQMYGMEFADFLSAAMGITEDQFNEQIKDVAADNINTELCLKAILEAEGIEITDADYEDAAENYGFESVDDMKEEAGSTGMESIYLEILQNKAYSILSENLTIAEDDKDTEADSEEDAEDAAEESTKEDTAEE